MAIRVLVLALVAILSFLFSLNQFLRGARKREVEGWLGLLIIGTLMSAFFMLGWKWGLVTLFAYFALILISRPVASAIARRLRVGKEDVLLDVGAGPGSYARALLARHPGLKAVLFDLPAAVAVARGFFREPSLKRRVTFRPGDYRRDSLGRGDFDIVLISHVTHNEDEEANRALIAARPIKL